TPAAGCIEVPATVKMFPRKTAYIKVALAAEREFYFVGAFGNQGSETHTANAQRVVYQAFLVAAVHVKQLQVFPAQGDNACLVLRQYLHLFQQYIPQKLHPPN